MTKPIHYQQITRKAIWPLIRGLVTFLLSTSLFANPVLDHVAAGQISIQQAPNSTVINQSSQQAIINWQSFNIGAQESTHFQQPQGGVALNRINPSQGVSQIYGRLTASGQIILVNPAGIFFGPGAYVNVGGLIATTANITDNDFLNHYYHFTKDANYNGAVVNQGTIIAANNGLVALIGGAVSNSGMIQANMGHVILASGERFTMTFAGNDLVSFTVDSGIHSRAVDKDGNELAYGVSNTGSLYANGGHILISAKDAARVLDNVINMRGIAQARAVVDGEKKHDGEIILWGDLNGGVVKVAGELDASSNIASNGGNIMVMAYDLFVEDGTSFNVSSIDGNGGFIETSGIHGLSLGDISIQTSSQYGSAGTWLIDPGDILISALGNQGTTSTPPFSATASIANLNVATLISALEIGNVTVQTTNDGLVGSGNITVASPISWNSTNTLLLQAYNDIMINAAINAAEGTLSLQAGSANNTITTNINGSINVASFDLLRGKWLQVTPNLPEFRVKNNFALAAGTHFLRATGGNGTPILPFLISDIYALQGIGMDASTLAQSYQLTSTIDASPAIAWNNEQGLKPIGSITQPFIGTLNGQNFTVNHLSIQPPMNNATGLFGVIGVGGSVSNLGVAYANIQTNNNINSTNNASGILAGVNLGTITDSFSTGTITANNNNYYVGGLVGFNGATGIIKQSYAKAFVIAGTSSTSVGGLVGASSGTINNAYTQGRVTADYSQQVGGLVGTLLGGNNNHNYAASEVNGTGSIAIGGLVGSLVAGSMQNSFWDIGVSRQSTSAAGIGKSTTELQSITTFVAAGWNLVGTWNMMDSVSYPYLRNINANVLRVISGSSPAANTTVNLAVNGMIAATTTTNINGDFSFYYSDLDNTPILVYLDNGNNMATTVTRLPENGADISGGKTLTLIDQTVTVGNPGSILKLSNHSLAAALGELSDPNILFTTSEMDITLALGVSLLTLPGTNYLLDGNITTISGGNLNFNGPVTVHGANQVALTSSGNINLGAVDSLHAYGNNSLSLQADNMIFLTGPINAPNTTLTLSAINATQSIQPGASTAVNVANFYLTQGNWYQNIPTLPSFQVSGNFVLGSQTLPFDDVSFTRVTNGSGDSQNPYTIVDIFGLQGIAANTANLDQHYQLGMNIDATVTSNWRGGAGFAPIGSTTSPFTGNFDGKQFKIVNLKMTNATQTAIGLFSALANTAIISNIIFDNPIIQGTYQVGVVAGYSEGNIQNIIINGGSAQSVAGYLGAITGKQLGGQLINLIVNNMLIASSGQNYIGGVAGYTDNTSLADNRNNHTNVTGQDYVGGIVGSLNNSTINRAFNTGTIMAASTVGGIAGHADTSIITNSANLGNIMTTHGTAGGIAGMTAQTTIDYVYNTGRVVNDGTDSAPMRIGGIAGYTQSPSAVITNAYNFGYVSGNESNAAGNSIGGIIGSSDTTNGTLGFLYNVGAVNGTTASGALIGEMVGTAPIYSGNSYWNSDTSGQTVGVSNATPTEVISKTTAEMKQEATYVGWNFSPNSSGWSIIENISYPVMQIFYPDISTARVISGSTDLSAGRPVGLIYNGMNFNVATTGADSSFYFFEGDNAVSGQIAVLDDALLMVSYLEQPALANYLFNAPAGNGSVTGISLGSNTFTAGSGVLSNTTLSTLLGTLSGTDFLFSLNGNNLMLGNADFPNANLVIGADTTFDLNGNIYSFDSGAGSNLTFNSPLNITTNAVIDLGNGILTFNSPLNGAYDLMLSASGGINITDSIGSTTPLTSLMLSGGGNTTISAPMISTTGNQTYNNPVNFSANTSLTVGTGSTLSLMSGATGGPQAVTLNGSGNNIFTLGGAFTVGSILVNGAGNNNTLNADNTSAQNWNITAPNTGAIGAMNLAFSGIQNIIGGSQSDVFHFSEGARISGMIDGGDSTTLNDIRFDTFTSNVTIRLGMPVNNIIDAGEVYSANNTLIVGFSQVQMSHGNGTSRIILPNHPNMKVTYYDSTLLNGEIADPFFFTGYTVSGPESASPTTNSHNTAATSSTANPNVANIVNQTETLAKNNSEENDDDYQSSYQTMKNRTSTQPLMNSTTVQAGKACYNAVPGEARTRAAIPPKRTNTAKLY